ISRHRRPTGRQRYVIAILVAVAAVLGAAGIAVAYVPRGGTPVASTTALDVADRNTQRASRDFPRTDSPSPSPSASPSPSPSPSASPSPSPSSPSPSPTPKRTTQAAQPTPAIPAGCSSYSGNQLIACQLLPSFGFSTSEMSALVPMWNNESGWNQYAENP